MNKKTNEIIKRLLIKFAIILGILIAFQYLAGLDRVQAATDYSEKQRIYLSDIPYNSDKLTEKSSVGWGSITMDKNLDSSKNNGLISLIVDNKPKTFLKGISAHANSQVIFDVEDLVAQGFTKFSTYYGVDAGRGSTGVPVAFKITYKTDANSPWQTEGALPLTSGYKGNTPAGFIEIDLTGKKFIKLEAWVSGANTAAHACYGSPQVYKPGFTEESAKADFIKTVEEYDSIIKEKSKASQFNITDDYELMLLQRDLVNTIGYDLLQEYVALDTDNLNIVKWLMTDINNLKPFMMGGKPEGGNYFKAFDILLNLYKQRGDDLKDTTEITTTRGKSTLAEMYKTMMFGISLTHSGSVYFWVNGSNLSDPIERYDIYKRLYHGKVVADDRTTKGIGNDLIEKTKFASLHVEEMRWVMNTIIDNEEIEWLNWYAREVKNGAVGPYSYQAYTFSYNYNKDQYYSEENRAKWTQKYNLSSTDKWNITYGRKGNPKLWIVFEEGSVCGGLSKNGACVWGAFKGLPNTCVSQPGHCAYLYYNQDADGNGVWGLGNDVGGWHQTGRTEHLNVRMPLEWGNEEYIDFNKDWLGMGTYVLLSQGALNNYEKYTKSKELLMLADVYKNDNEPETLNKIYEKSLDELSINIDAWYGLIKSYRQDTTKTDEDYYKLAEGIFKELKFYPLPMYHLAREVQKDLKTAEYQFQFVLDQTKTLNEAKVVNDNAKDESGKKLTLQGAAVRQEATHLLGQTDSRLATFSFDGENAGAIKLGQRFEGSDVAWDYSLDGKQTWTQATDAYDAGAHIQKLTDAQIKSITAANDIYVHIIGAGYEAENCYKIDILDNVISEDTYYGNDLENRVIGVNSSFEWRNSENDPWTSYSAGSPDLTGNKTLQIRQVANGVKLASNVLTFTFTEDNQPDTRKYIPVSHLSIHSVSTQATNNQGAATYAIDGNYNTRWHSAWNGSDTERFIVIKLDKSVALSAVEFVPAGGGNGRIVDGTVYGSMDGENWEELARITGQTYPEQANTNEQAKTYTKSFEIAEPKEVQYVKIEANRASNGNWFTARAFNLYQDLTQNPHPTAGIAYDTTEPTNGAVVARLINPSTEITITNNNGSDTYVFTENGEFTFEFTDANGNKGSAVAAVNWIDKSGPTADVEYSLNDDRKLSILLDNISEDVYLLDENNNKINYIEVDENKKITSISYLDNSGNAYKILDKDASGNTTKITYKNTVESVSTVTTYVTTLENGVVVSEGYFDNEGNAVTIADAEKEALRALQEIARSNPLEKALEASGDYEFKLVDKAENILYKSIKVDYIENGTTIIASDITYDITGLTNKNVIATINPYIIDISGKNASVEVISDGGTTHTFTENGEFTFEYKSASDTENWEVKQHKAKVDWIDKVAPTAEISYSPEEATDKPVVATLVNESEEIIITNNGTSREYTFTENGTFTFKFRDKAGNEGTAVATVGWILEDTTVTSEKYKVRTEYISKIPTGTTVAEFRENVTSQEELTIADKEGNILQDGSILSTGMILNAGTEKQYTLALIGDIDGDGAITLIDLVRLKLFEAEILTLNTIEKLAADIDGDGYVNLIDLVRLNLIVAGIIK